MSSYVPVWTCQPSTSHIKTSLELFFSEGAFVVLLPPVHNLISVILRGGYGEHYGKIRTQHCHLCCFQKGTHPFSWEKGQIEWKAKRHRKACHNKGKGNPQGRKIAEEGSLWTYPQFCCIGSGTVVLHQSSPSNSASLPKSRLLYRDLASTSSILSLMQTNDLAGLENISIQE